jgi:hypothetical protein
LLNYANLPVEDASILRLEPKPNATRIADEIAETKRRCGQLLPLDNLHAAMIGYMGALGALATAGSAPSTTSGPATQTPAAAVAPPAAVALTGADFCAAPLPKPQASPGGAAKPSAAQTATANALGTDLTAFAKASPALHISAADATAAGTLAKLFIDVATTAARETAITNALHDGHDAFLAAIAVETAVLQYGLSAAAGNSDDLQQYNDALAEHLTIVASTSQGPNQATAVKETAALAIALASGTLLTPAQAANLRAAAQGYLTALVNLQKAYNALTAAAGAGAIFSTATWNQIQSPLADVAAAYTAVNKL